MTQPQPLTEAEIPAEVYAIIEPFLQHYPPNTRLFRVQQLADALADVFLSKRRGEHADWLISEDGLTVTPNSNVKTAIAPVPLEGDMSSRDHAHAADVALDAEWDDLELVRALVHDLRHCGGKLANATDLNRKTAGRSAGELAVLALNAADCINYLAVTILALAKDREQYKAALLEELAPPPLPDDKKLTDAEATAIIEAWAGPMPSSAKQSDRDRSRDEPIAPVPSDSGMREKVASAVQEGFLKRQTWEEIADAIIALVREGAA